MLTLEDFISKRKKDDQLDVFDLLKKDYNMQACVNYVFEYFNTYINLSEKQKAFLETNEKIQKYQKQIKDYSTETQEWLMKMYKLTGKTLNRVISKELKYYDTFLLLNDESHFRKVSYQIYSTLYKRYNFLKDYTEELVSFIKDQHAIWSSDYNIDLEAIDFHINEKVDNYLVDTARKYHVDLLAWADSYSEVFYSYENIWPVNCVTHDKYTDYYDVTKAYANKFNIDYIYSQVSLVPYIKGKKKLLEVLVMYYWQKNICSVDDDYYEKYMQESCKKL